MTYTDFEEECTSLLKSKLKYWDKERSPEGDYILVNEWHIGGSSGGSCWGSRSEPYTIYNGQPEFTALDLIVETFFSSKPYALVKMALKCIMETGVNKGESDWYGNYSDYAYQKVNLRKLYEALVSVEDEIS